VVIDWVIGFGFSGVSEVFVCGTLSGMTWVIAFFYTGYTQKNGAVLKVNKKFISQLSRAQCTPSAAAAVQVSHALPAVRFSCLMRGLCVFSL
jgi:hypothetical protein